VEEGMSAQHSCATPEHGTPAKIIDLARATLGGIDLDPASSPQWNRFVCARRIITAKQNGLHTPWFTGAPAPLRLGTDKTEPWCLPTCLELGTRPPRNTVFLNPPGDKRGELVARFWCALAEYYRRYWVTSAIWVGFNVEQLARLQRVGAVSHPLEHTTLIPRERIAYRDTPTTIGEDPSHASFVTLLSDSASEIETFAALGSELGHVVYCGRPRR
jgi:hypothetical protein